MNSTTGTGDSILSVVSSAEISKNYLLDQERFQYKNERTHKPPVKVSEDPEPESELVLVAAGVEDEVLVEVFFDLVEEAWVVSAAAVVSGAAVVAGVDVEAIKVATETDEVKSSSSSSSSQSS